MQKHLRIMAIKKNSYLYKQKHMLRDKETQKMRDLKSICNLNNNQINQWATIDTLKSWKTN